MTKGLNPEGAIVINSERSAAELRPMLRGYEGRVYTIDARKVSEECLGKYFPNTPMLAAIVEVSRVLEPEQFIADMEATFRHKSISVLIFRQMNHRWWKEICSA